MLQSNEANFKISKENPKPSGVENLTRDPSKEKTNLKGEVVTKH
jgi:hypothetical protein